MIRLTACWKLLSPRAIQDLQALSNHLEAVKNKKEKSSDQTPMEYLFRHTKRCCLWAFPSVHSWYYKTLVTAGGCVGVWCCCCRLVASVRGSANGVKTGVRPGQGFSSSGKTGGSAGVMRIQRQRYMGRRVCARAVYDCCAWVNKLSVCLRVCSRVLKCACVRVCTVYGRESQWALKRRRAGNAPRHRKQANFISHYGELQRDGAAKGEVVEYAGS